MRALLFVVFLVLCPADFAANATESRPSRYDEKEPMYEALASYCEELNEQPTTTCSVFFNPELDRMQLRFRAQSKEYQRALERTFFTLASTLCQEEGRTVWIDNADHKQLEELTGGDTFDWTYKKPNCDGQNSPRQNASHPLWMLPKERWEYSWRKAEFMAFARECAALSSASETHCSFNEARNGFITMGLRFESEAAMKRYRQKGLKLAADYCKQSNRAVMVFVQLLSTDWSGSWNYDPGKCDSPKVYK